MVFRGCCDLVGIGMVEPGQRRAPAGDQRPQAVLGEFLGLGGWR